MVDERALDGRGGVHRAGVEQHVVPVLLGLEERGDLLLDVDRAARGPRPDVATQAEDATTVGELEQAVLEGRVREADERVEDRRGDQGVTGEHAVAVDEILAELLDRPQVGVGLEGQLDVHLGARRRAAGGGDDDRGIRIGVLDPELDQRAQSLRVERAITTDDQATSGPLDPRAAGEHRRATQVLPRQIRQDLDVQARKLVQGEAIPQLVGVATIDDRHLGHAELDQPFQGLPDPRHGTSRELVAGLEDEPVREHNCVRDHRPRRLCNKRTARDLGHLLAESSGLHHFVSVV